MRHTYSSSVLASLACSRDCSRLGHHSFQVSSVGLKFVVVVRCLRMCLAARISANQPREAIDFFFVNFAAVRGSTASKGSSVKSTPSSRRRGGAQGMPMGHSPRKWRLSRSRPRRGQRCEKCQQTLKSVSQFWKRGCHICITPELYGPLRTSTVEGSTSCLFLAEMEENSVLSTPGMCRCGKSRPRSNTVLGRRGLRSIFEPEDCAL